LLTRPAFAVATGLLRLGARRHVRSGYSGRRTPAKSASLIAELRRLFAALAPGVAHAPRR
jgi:hypothetical protein